MNETAAASLVTEDVEEREEIEEIEEAEDPPSPSLRLPAGQAGSGLRWAGIEEIEACFSLEDIRCTGRRGTGLILVEVLVDDATELTDSADDAGRRYGTIRTVLLELDDRFTVIGRRGTERRREYTGPTRSTGRMRMIIPSVGASILGCSATLSPTPATAARKPTVTAMRFRLIDAISVLCFSVDII